MIVLITKVYILIDDSCYISQLSYKKILQCNATIWTVNTQFVKFSSKKKLTPKLIYIGAIVGE